MCQRFFVFAHGFSLEIEFASVVRQAVEDGRCKATDLRGAYTIDFDSKMSVLRGNSSRILHIN